MAKLPRPFRDWTTYKGHGGIDYPKPLGAVIRASGPGRVTFSGWWSKAGGYAVFVEYDNGLQCRYMHLPPNAPRAHVAAKVRYGDRLGEVGVSGLTTGPHLHHETWVRGAIQMGDDYWKHIDKGSYVGDGSSTGTEDDMSGFTEDDRKLLKRVDEAIRNGKSGSHTDGSVTRIIKSIQRKVGALDGSDLTRGDLDELAAELKAQLPPAVAKELSRRLAT